MVAVELVFRITSFEKNSSNFLFIAVVQRHQLAGAALRQQALKSAASINPKIEMFAPTPRASDITATIVNACSAPRSQPVAYILKQASGMPAILIRISPMHVALSSTAFPATIVPYSERVMLIRVAGAKTPDPWMRPTDLDRGRFETATQPKTSCLARPPAGGLGTCSNSASPTSSSGLSLCGTRSCDRQRVTPFASGWPECRGT